MPKLIDMNLLAKVAGSRKLLGPFVERFDCGMMDGGCVLLALTIGQMTRLPVMTVWGKCSLNTNHAATPQHAVVLFGDFVIDGLGVTALKSYPDRLMRKELVVTGFSDMKPYTKGDFPEAEKLVTDPNIAWLRRQILALMKQIPTRI